MKVPKEIREVPRPEGTIVYPYGDPPKYNVKERTYWKDENGKQHQKDGATIGSIEDGRFVPMKPRMSFCDADIRTWAPSRLIMDRTRDVLDDLLSIYHHKEAWQIYTMAVLRTVDAGIKDYEMAEAYGLDHISVSHPDIALSKNTVGRLLFDLGRTYTKIVEFMRLRTARVPANHIVAADGLLKSYESDDNPLSDFSRKALITGSRDVAVMFAYDVDDMEPVCSQVNAGNVNDVAAFRGFMETNRIAQGMIIADKGFSYDTARDVFLSNPDLHFLIPLKRNSELISAYNLLHTEKTLLNRYGISCRTAKTADGRFLYAYRDTDRARIEEQTWLDNHRDGGFDPAELEEVRLNAGTIVFVSDLEASPETMYAAYEERWEIEVMFRFYKSILEMDETRVESVQSVIGTEFVNFLSVIMMSRLRKAFLKVEDLQRRSFRSCMKMLGKGMMIRTEPDGEFTLKKLTDKEVGIFTELGLIEPPVVVPRKRGRPKGSKNKKK